MIRLRETMVKIISLCLLIILSLATPRSYAGESAAKTPKVPAADNPPIGTGKLIFEENFESTAAGQIPKGFTKQGNVSVVEDVSHSGKKSLRIEPAVNGPRRIVLKGEPVAALGGQHWGRLYFKVQLPTPIPEGEGKFPVIHSTLVAGSAQSPSAKDHIEVRVLDTVMGPKGTFQYIYNVQPQKRPEFAHGGKYTNQFSDQWTLAEWYVDYATQTYRFFINGEELKDVSFSKGAGNFEGSEIPEVFESLSFGWWNYQQAGKGFTAWIDDIALSKERIGNRGIAPAKPTR
jgi:hypothetical protein